MTRDGHRQVGLADLLIAIRHNKIHMGEVGVGVGELIWCQPHVGFANNRSRRRNLTAYQDCTFRRCKRETGVNVIECVVRCGSISSYSMGLPIIACRVFCTHNCYRNSFCNWCHRQRRLIAFHRVAVVGGFHLIGQSADIGDAGSRGGVFAPLIIDVFVAVGEDSIGLITMPHPNKRIAIVNLAKCIRFHGQWRSKDGQSGFSVSNIVVVRHDSLATFNHRSTRLNCFSVGAYFRSDT